mmetsp:Transcript_19375/g.45261  ORF Transcript_19375/g.45261 Transcript_19375/m.45261 type:complete len:152 (+) Transcript_19375:38-493(+)
MQTVVHGDAKDANMLFSTEGGQVVAQLYDFQYAGRAPPSKDLAYFLACAAGAAEGETEDVLLARYHATLSSALLKSGKTPPKLGALRESLWVAYADLARFMSGWGWWARNGLSQKARRLLDELDGGKELSSAEEYTSALFRRLPPDYSAGN